jgi:hypothetical protein
MHVSCSGSYGLGRVRDPLVAPFGGMGRVTSSAVIGECLPRDITRWPSRFHR